VAKLHPICTQKFGLLEGSLDGFVLEARRVVAVEDALDEDADFRADACSVNLQLELQNHAKILYENSQFASGDDSYALRASSGPDGGSAAG
jgi:hypothetical protein